MATIGKTFSDPDKWESAWFTKLSNEQKLLFCYMWERCDHAGVIEYVPDLWNAHTGLEIDKKCLENFIEIINKGKIRLLMIGDKCWFPEYIRFNQQSDPDKSLNANYSFHRHVFRRLKEHGLIDEVQKRDNILLAEFQLKDDEKSEISESSTSLNQESLKPSLSLSQDSHKSTGKGTSSGGGVGRGQGDSDTIDDISPFKNFTP